MASYKSRCSETSAAFDHAERVLNEGLGLVYGQFKEVSASVLALSQGNQARGSNEHAYLEEALTILDTLLLRGTKELRGNWRSDGVAGECSNRRIYSQKEGTVLADNESDMFPIKRKRRRGTHCPAYSSKHCCNSSGRRSELMAGHTKKHQTERQKRRLPDEFEIRGRRTAPLYVAGKLREILCEFKTSTNVVGLGIHPDKTKILSNQEKEKKKREITVDNIKIEGRSCQRKQCAISWT